MSEDSSPRAATPSDPHVGKPQSATATALASYYADRMLMWRNVSWITFGHFGMAVSTTILVPLMNLRLKSVGVRPGLSERIVRIVYQPGLRSDFPAPCRIA